MILFISLFLKNWTFQRYTSDIDDPYTDLPYTTCLWCNIKTNVLYTRWEAFKHLLNLRRH